MKKLFLLLLTLVLAQMACNLPRPISAPIPREPLFVVVTATNLPASAAPLLTATSTSEAAAAPTSTPTETPSPEPTPTETPDPAKLFQAVNLSAQVFSTNCAPKTVRFEVTADPQVYSVVLFIRLNYKTAGERTPWNDGIAMKPLGNGKFFYDLNAANVPYFNKQKDPVAWLQFQLVATAQGGGIIGRSKVYTDQLTLSAICP